ncbi:killer cell immunoglobulin-like receptor 3DL2 isoform X2 [Pygocentrus nattereri]|uniref:killer cell immunoglobulin-like receptor 3DL2 isoform X2 n=1 Tax=Pygocentrus nattereri TaxID=42514 RepID=UPI0008149233|nr:killer cell immunoglobulin-like receptor 3DL2 isoform X2 [Pygocentrus nattereri]
MPLCGLVFTFLLVFSARDLRVCGVGVDNHPSSPPAPELIQVQVSGPAVLLQCRAPAGHGGRLFKLYRLREQVDMVQSETEQTQAEFRVQGRAVEQENHYCCQYDNSAISQYFTIRAAPSPITPPHLSVKPPAGDVLPGKVLDFHCQAPSPSPGNPPLIFLLMRRLSEADSDQEVGRSTDPYFRVGPVSQADSGTYTCIYQLTLPEGVQISAPSPPVSIKITGPITPPHLSVTPPAGHVLPDKVLDFHCQAPSPSPGNPPPIFLLMRRLSGADSDQEVGRSSDPNFRVGPVSQADSGTYTCIYQLNLPEGVQMSASSPPVSIKITAHLPAPLLSSSHEDMLLCTGSPSYPGAHFSLYHQGAKIPIETQQALVVKHSAQFAVKAEGWYQCQYSVLLGTVWAHSERSSALKLPCTTGSPSCSPSGYTPPPTGGKVDLALIIGSVSAALLFLLVLIILGFAVHKHAKAAAAKRRQSEQDTFWKQFYFKDHIVDLTLQRINTSPAEFSGAGNERISVSEPIYDCPFSTFNGPLDK